MTATADPAPLTDRQRKILTYLVEFWADRQHFPTVRDICAEFGFSSPVAPRSHMLALVRKGYLAYTPGGMNPFGVVGLAKAVEAAAMNHLDRLLADGPPRATG